MMFALASLIPIFEKCLGGRSLKTYMNAKTHRFDLDMVPKAPGVYLMKDSEGSVIYVGKAINLRNRLRNYFAANPTGNNKVLAMISHIDHFDYLLCENETEALILECNLIKQYQPHYNILLRDDKEYPYIRITFYEEYPRVMKSFRVGDDVKQGAKYYGPYLASHLKSALETLRTIFPIKSCKLVLPKDIKKSRPCLNYFIGRCVAPCQGYVGKEEYNKIILGIAGFLEGRYEGLMQTFKKDMQEAAQHYDFEKAAVYRDRLNSLNQLMEKQTVTDLSGKDMDVIGYTSNQVECCIRKLEIRKGRLIGSAVLFAFEEDIEKEDLLPTLLLQYYTTTPNIPGRIDIPFEIHEQDLTEKALSSIAGKSVKLKVPMKGYGKQMMQLAMNNALESLRRHSLTSGKFAGMGADAIKILSEVLFGEPNAVTRIEAYDVSNYGDEDISASMVVFIDGRADKSQYRLFRIQELDRQDDYSALKQAVRRRLLRLDSKTDGFKDTPSLILVDGGIQHVHAVQQVLLETGYGQIELMGMIKDQKHKTRALVRKDGSILTLTEQDESFALSLEHRRALMRLIATIQNEAHRFARNYTQNLSKKRNIRYSLESIRGIGPGKRKLLLNTFGSLRKIAQADLDALQQVKGMNSVTAMAVYRYFHP
jgi:excinuclease ABC subunit C